MTLEQELIDIFASTPSQRNREILIGYYGWKDGRQHTLTEVGTRFGITRERVRQVCAKLTKRLKTAPVSAPIMDRVLKLISEMLPAPAARIEAELAGQGFTAIGMSLETVAAAARLLDRSVEFEIVAVHPDNRPKKRKGWHAPERSEGRGSPADHALRSAQGRATRTLFHRPVPLVHVNDNRPQPTGLLLVHRAIGKDDDLVAGDTQPGGGTVEHDRTRAGGGLDHVCGYPLGVREVQHVDLFAGQQVGRLDQIPIDGDASLVIQLRAGQRGTMNFGSQHKPLHARSPTINRTTSTVSCSTS